MSFHFIQWISPYKSPISFTDIIDKGKLSYSLLQNVNVSNMPNLTGLLTHTKKSYYKVINLSSWTPQLFY